MGKIAHVRIDDAQIHQRQRLAGLAAQRQMLFGVEDESGFHLRAGQDRAGLGHAVAAPRLDAALGRAAGEPERHCRAADDDLPALEVGRSGLRRVQHHLQDCRHAVGEADALLLDQLQERSRLIAAGVDLLHAQQAWRGTEIPRRARGTSASAACRRRPNESAAQPAAWQSSSRCPGCAARSGDG